MELFKKKCENCSEKFGHIGSLSLEEATKRGLGATTVYRCQCGRLYCKNCAASVAMAGCSCGSNVYDAIPAYW